MSRLSIVPGLCAPFYPMRPYRGPKLDKTTVGQIMAKMKLGDTIQRKLNGDRANLVVIDDQVKIFNRYMTQFSHTVLNASDFLRLGGPTVLDGEVWKSRFYPFECVVFKGLSLVENGPKDREACAKHVCEKLNLPWLYEVTEAWLQAEIKLPHDLRSQWEGVVVKKANSPYRVLGTDAQESPFWGKWKWC